MPYALTKRDQELKGKVSLFAKGVSKHCAIQSWKGWMVTDGIRAQVLKGRPRGHTLEIQLVIGI